MNWKVWNIVFSDLSMLRTNIDKFIQICQGLVQERRNEDFFYNLYSDSKSSYLKLGLKNPDTAAESVFIQEIDRQRHYGSVRGLDSVGSDLQEVDGQIMDEIKCASTALAGIVKKRFSKSPSGNQAFYLIHFMMNDLGFGYQDEIRVYENLLRSIKAQHPEIL
jgi:hypothetical protein